MSPKFLANFQSLYGKILNSLKSSLHETVIHKSKMFLNLGHCFSKFAVFFEFWWSRVTFLWNIFSCDHHLLGLDGNDSPQSLSFSHFFSLIHGWDISSSSSTFSRLLRPPLRPILSTSMHSNFSQDFRPPFCCFVQSSQLFLSYNFAYLPVIPSLW